MMESARASGGSVVRWSLLTVPIVVVLGLASGWVSGSGADGAWFAALAKPSIFPPPFLFGVVWTILYVLMGFALAYVLASPKCPARRTAVAFFAAQMAVNLAWSPLFFAAHEIGLAFAWILLLIALVVVTMACFVRISRMAMVLLVPYLAWIAFAAVLNLRFWQLN